MKVIKNNYKSNEVTCPHCTSVLGYDPEDVYDGRFIKCPLCDNPVRIVDEPTIESISVPEDFALKITDECNSTLINSIIRSFAKMMKDSDEYVAYTDDDELIMVYKDLDKGEFRFYIAPVYFTATVEIPSDEGYHE